MDRISESVLVVNRVPAEAGLFAGRSVAVVPPAGVSQAKRLWSMAKADVPGAMDQFVAGNANAVAALSQGEKRIIFGTILGDPPEHTMLSALARGLGHLVIYDLWHEVCDRVCEEVGCE
jgi:hypothetical protein